ncbi:putative uncharacterized protein DDB_G0282133 isoform X7 [Condylostylus longicornis]|uniref:putative uncharacterized protein DDB_G0282133 isoform X7 n=1 Tax=Condylostylus longicornis TaxID=2530218 RepID=UPI00244DD954|nr:putative uncharacterized protein DDB_G0282133 isoform X7 [Condylostylus longicornis]
MMDRAILFIGLIAIAFCGSVSGGIDKTIKQQKGRTVVLECPIDGEACGDLHSLNWFKGDTRIAVILGGVNVSSVIPEYSERVKLEESPYRLTLNDLRISDEDVYICDTTFYIPQESCDATRGYRTEVIVLEHPPPVPPSDILVLDEKNDKITNGSIIGPVEEGKTLTAICKVEKTRPQPSMAWYRGNKRLTTHSPSYDEDEDGLFTATLELSLVLSRQDLDNDIECRVESAALDDIYKSLIKLDLQVRPTGIQLEGVGHHTTQGTLTTLSCKVAGARPSANISWTNGTEIIDPNENGDGVDIRLYHQLQKDGTYDTESQLIFTASRFENDITFGCHATNIVIKRNNEKPIHAEIPLEVLYPPVVEVLEDDITVNEHKKTTLTCEFIANPASLTGVRWYKNGEPIKINKSGHYEGGSPDHVPLTILNAHRDDRGNYTCELTNSIGSGNSTVQIQLDVLYVPSVEVIMLPKGPVKENDEVNVTLLCNITDANPWALTKVRWFANSTLLKELPDCSNQNNNSEDLCNIDPSKLLLESVGRGFAYNYSCEGFNTAGWGNRSQEVELVVFHEPGPARLTYYPLTVVKKQSVTFSCTVDVLGVPEATQYRWFRGGQGPLIDVYKKDWTIELVDLDSRTNFSCLAYNDGGKGEQATVTLDVKAPPFFIKNLLPYTGVLFSTKNASLTCRVECVPRCKINWFKDGVGIYANDTSKYHIYEEYLKENPATGDFESVLSILHFNMSAWPNQQFDMHYDNANYSCVASENEVGAGVRSATYFSIEYPPENTTVSNEIVNVTENTIPARVLCNSKANPEPSYEWTLEEKSLAQGNALIINKPMLRNESGHYKCIAFNKHGSSEATTFVNVQYKPHCDIDRKMIDDQDTLICTAYGNPDEFGFVWSIKTENDSVEVSSGSIDGDKAFLVLNDDFTITRTYRCVANNTIGEGHMCEIEVAVRPKRQLAWWQRWDRTTLIIVIAAVSAILLAVIIICCIIICICRRRRRQDKLHDKSSTLADPLTEPGEYENLPFHGLQQAPNKFTTTPINFNNNTNVVRVAPRPKLTQTNNHHQKNLDQFHQIFNQQQLQQQNITTNNQNNYHQKSIQFPNQNQHQSQQQLHYQIQQQYSPADCYTNSLKLIQNKTKTKNLNYGSSTLKLEKRKPIVGGTIDNNLQDITRVTTDRFPTSYTEYFQQQKFSDIISSDNQNNLIDRTTLNPNYPYTVVENGIITPTSTTTQLAPQSSTSSSSVSSSRIVFNNSNSTNPFLATNFRKFQISTGTRPGCGTITANHRKKHHSNNSSNNSIIGSGEKKFYSLKALKNKNNLSFSSIKPSALLSNSNNSNSNNKCKRHHSFAGGSFADVINGIDTNNSIDITANNLPYTMQPKIKFYEPPTYENLTDSIQIHESPSENLIQQQTSDINTQTHLKQQQQPQQQLINTSKTKTSNKQNNQTVTTGSSTSSSSKLSNSINLSTSSTTSSVVGGIGNQYNIIQKQNQQKHQHHQTQRQKMNDDNTKKHLMEPERMSIYRSDSGISNSSYECVTPIAPPRQYNLLDDDIIDTTICINNKNDNDDNDIDNDIINNHHHFGDAIDKCNPDVTKTNRIDKLYNSAINSTTSTTSTNLSSYNNSINNRKLLENDFDRLHNDTNNSTYNNSLLNPELSHLYLNNPNKSQYTSNSTNQKNSIADTINVVNTNNDFTTTASNIINATNKTNNIMHDGLSVKCQNKKNDQHEQRQHNQKKPITITTSNTSINTIDNSRSNIIINSSNKIGSKRRTNTASPLANSSYNGTANIVGHEQRSINTNPFLVTSPSTTSSSSSSGCISNNSINDKGSSSFFSSTSSQSDEFKSSSTISPSSTSSFASTVREGFTSSCDGIQASSSITPISSINKYKKLKSSQIQYQPNESYIESITEKENSDAESSIITSKSLNAKYQLKNRIINNDFQQKEKSSSSLSLSIKDIVTQNETTSNRLLSNDILNTKHATQINNKFYEMIKNRYPGYITKSIKQIPLRKHHSFHFQQYYPNPNTMLGQLKLHQIQKEQAKAAAVALQTSSFDSTILRDASNIKNIYKQVGGPLIYRPFLNENTAFKPISPVNRTKFSTTFPTTNYLSDSESNCYRYQYNSNATETEEESLNFERIHNRYPIVSLKRHASNIESYDSKRYSTYYENSRENSPCTEEKIISEQAHNQMNFIENKENHHSLSELEDDDDNDRDDDEIFMQHDDDANSSASNSTIVGKRLIYVDFDIVSTTKSDNNCYQSNQHENENYKSNEFNNETPNNEEQSINSNDNYCDNNQQNNVDNCEKNYYLKKNSSNDQELSKIKSKSDDLFHKNSIQNKKSTIKLIKSSLENKDETDQENKLKSNEIEKIQKDEINKEVDEEVEDICETSSITGIILAKPPTKRNTQYATLKYNEVKI